MDFDHLDKNKSYCSVCFNIGVLTELEDDLNNHDKYLPPKCGHLTKGFRRLSFINNKWSKIIGINKNSKPIDYTKREFNLFCITCGSSFKSKTSNEKYCSDKCKPKAICSYCKKEFILIRQRNEKVFCSLSCSSKYTQEHLTEEQKEIQKENGRKNLQKAHEYWNSKEGRKRRSEICAKTNLTSERKNLVKQQWQNNEFKEKMTNLVIQRWKNGVYGNLAYDNLQKINTRKDLFCNKCNKITIHNGFNKCLTCFPNSGGFNREEFYKKELNIISFDYLNGNYKDFINLSRTSGVWAIWNKLTNECIQVGQNEDIGKELKRQLRLISKYKMDNWEDDNPNAKYFHNLGLIEKEGGLEIKIVAKDIKDLKIRWKIECQYAHDNKAKYWSPEPGQNLS